MNPVIEVDTSTPVDVRELADRIGRILERSGSSTRRPSAI